MSRLRERLRPLQHHVLGIPKEVQEQLKHLKTMRVSIVNTEYVQLISRAESLYQHLLKQAKSYEAVADAKCPEEKLDHAAELFAHQILDLAFIHDAIASTGYPIGEFPYNDVADQLFSLERLHDNHS